MKKVRLMTYPRYFGYHGCCVDNFCWWIVPPQVNNKAKPNSPDTCRGVWGDMSLGCHFYRYGFSMSNHIPNKRAIYGPCGPADLPAHSLLRPLTDPIKKTASRRSQSLLFAFPWKEIRLLDVSNPRNHPPVLLLAGDCFMLRLNTDKRCCNILDISRRVPGCNEWRDCGLAKLFWSKIYVFVS